MLFLGKGLPRLESLYVEQSYLANPRSWRDLLSLPSIELVSDVTWSTSCNHCNITKSQLNSNVTLDPCGENCSKTSMYYSKGTTVEESSGEICWFYYQSPWFTSYVSPSWYLSPGFTLQCLCDPRNCTTHPPLNPFYLFQRLVQRLLDCLYPLASVGLLLNAVVTLMVPMSKDLRKSPTVILIWNMALCDFLMGLWCVLIATFNVFPDSDDDVQLITYHGKYPDSSSFFVICRFLSFIFCVTQIATVMTSLFLTVERYLVIVYSMKPDVRMTKKISAICVCVTWCTAVAYNIYSVFLLSDYNRKMNIGANYYLCTASGNSIGVTSGWKFRIPMSTFLGVFYILIFLCTIPLYIHIFIVVRKSSTQMGVKREGALARKLALLVITNLLFSTIPLSLAPLFSNLTVVLNLGFSKTLSSLKVAVICSVWVPILLLCLNSCLNPFLFAFQHRLFKRHFRKTCLTILQYSNKEQVAHVAQQLNEQRVRNRPRMTETAL